ncbi:MAG: hypothetical protein ABEJ69_03940 [Candidatus Nanohaloarchaea archaeon]
MKKTVVLLTSFALLLSMAGAVVNYSGPEDQPHIMGGSSASATTGVGPNGTKYTAKVEMRNRTGNITDERLENINYSKSGETVTFTGYIQAPTPCHTIDSDVEKENNSYNLNVVTVAPSDDRACVQQLTMIKYEGEFSTDGEFTVVVQHDGKTIESLESPREGQDRNTGLLGLIFNWFTGLF